jgi:hypothetical protein
MNDSTYKRYVNLRKKYKDYCILNIDRYFYRVFDEDAILLNTLFDYKIVKEFDYIYTGFPTIALDKITRELEIYQINYIIAQKNRIVKDFGSLNKYQTFEGRTSNIHKNNSIIEAEGSFVVMFLDDNEIYHLNIGKENISGKQITTDSPLVQAVITMGVSETKKINGEIEFKLISKDIKILENEEIK